MRVIGAGRAVEHMSAMRVGSIGFVWGVSGRRGSLDARVLPVPLSLICNEGRYLIYFLAAPSSCAPLVPGRSCARRVLRIGRPGQRRAVCASRAADGHFTPTDRPGGGAVCVSVFLTDDRRDGRRCAGRRIAYYRRRGFHLSAARPPARTGQRRRRRGGARRRIGESMPTPPPPPPRLQICKQRP